MAARSRSKPLAQRQAALHQGLPTQGGQGHQQGASALGQVHATPTPPDSSATPDQHLTLSISAAMY